MIIVHRDELEPLIATRLPRQRMSGSSFDFLVLGTVDPRVWRRGLASGVAFDELIQHMADFRRYMQVEQTGRGWRPSK
jgi:hypothetical protein